MKAKYKLNLKYSIMGLFLILCAYIIISFISGARFSPDQAAKTSRWVENTSVLLGTAETPPYKVYIYENQDKYRTILTGYKFPFWRYRGSSWANKTEDKVKLVGWCSYSDGGAGKGITVVPVQSFDDRVAFIEMGSGPDLQRKPVKTGEVLLFSWEKSIKWNNLKAIACSGDNKVLYKLGYEVNNSKINMDELRWLPKD